VIESLRTPSQPTSADAICPAMNTIAGVLPIAVIVTYTTSGSTTLRASRERPAAPIVSMTPSVAIAHRLALAWGVHVVHTPDVADVAEMVDHAISAARDAGFATPGTTILISAGMPFGRQAPQICCALHKLTDACVHSWSVDSVCLASLLTLPRRSRRQGLRALTRARVLRPFDHP
jgi:pyruvate kinase